jgi:3-methyladenine DNA glycosylase AlkC
MGKITESLGSLLPSRYEDALAVLFAVSDDCHGFPYLIFPDFVARFGQGEKQWELSMAALEAFTRKSSSEFAVRPFILKDPERVMERMSLWARHPDEHVRRFSSEGCRPRLPWGEALPVFKKDPSPVMSVLELLKADDSLYVRKSVANNLNDISKDNPDAVLETAARWKTDANPYTDWIIRRGCRTLIRHADPRANALFGYENGENGHNPVSKANLSLSPSELKIGDRGEIAYEVVLSEGGDRHIRVEYGIDFVKANGHAARKLFLLTDRTVPGGTSLAGRRVHSWADLSVRRHYPGEHRITLLVNGQEMAAECLKLLPGT